MSTAACPTCGGNVDPETGVCPQCTTYVAVRSDSDAPTALGGSASETPEISGYRVIGSLGEGGMGAVYLAEETTLGRRVAVKVISSRIAPDAQSKARFLREARTLATIEHPHVVRVYSFGEVEGRPYLAMEYVEGETLMDRIARLGRLPVDDALRITRDIVDALDAAWDKRVIHRDIKPSNILIDRRNRVRVADFGLAKPKDVDQSESALTLSGLMVGTPHYVSPEQAQGKELDFRSDFYSLGIMLFHMLTGERPFQGSTPVAIVAKHLHEPMPLLTSRRADVPPAIERLIQWMTQKDVEKRPGSHQELLAAIDGLITRTPTSPMPTLSAVAIAATPKRKLRTWLVAGAAVLLAALAIGFYVWKSKEDAEPFPLAATKFVVAVAPFYGPDDDSAKEGRVMAALIERAVAQRLGKDNARVLGIEETKSAVRSHDEARELGTKLGASAVIWGEAFALRTETEIRPYVTLCTVAKHEEAKGSSTDARLLSDTRMNSFETIGDTGGAAVKLEAEAPNQIELRKTSASGIGDLVVLLAGIHALDNEKNYPKALALFRQAPRTAETLRYEVQALLQADRRDEARTTLEQAVALDPKNVASHVLLGDLLVADQRLPEALASYQRAAAHGQPYSATRGILHGGKLYIRETYRHPFANSGEETDMLSLLAIDPVTLRVLERWSLPGQIRSLRSEGETLVVGYDGGKDDAPLPAELRLTGGKFDRVLWPPSNLLWRLRSMRGGRIIAGNFLGEIDTIRGFGKPGGRYILRKEPAADLPATLPDLERALRAAADRDPTQPWHLLFLAITLREQKRMADANAVIDNLLRRDYPNVDYYHFTWMLATLERMHFTDWMDRLYPKAVEARRRLPQPPGFSALIERMVNAPFVRQAASNRDIARGYTVVARAREITGISEGEDLVAAAWARYLETNGDHARAEQERQLVRRVHAHPFNYLGMLAKVDYAASTTVAAFGAFVVLFLTVLVYAERRASNVAQTLLSANDGADRSVYSTSRLPRPVRAAIVGLLLGGVLLGAIWLVMSGVAGNVVLLLAVAVVGFLVVKRMRVSPKAILASVSRRERILLVVSSLVFVAAGVILIDRLAVVRTISGIPFGVNDGLGHPRLIADLEERLKTRPSEELRYVTAVANHYGGNKERANALYVAAGDYAATKANHDALRAGRMPVAPTPEELYLALRGSRLDRFAEVFRDWKPMTVLFGLLVLMLALFAVRPREHAEALPPPSRLSKSVMILVPGAYDVRRGALVRALVTLLCLMMPVVPLALSLADMPLGLGFVTEGLPSLTTSFPLPSTAADPYEDLRPVFRMAFPYARIYWTIVIGSLVLGLVLHLLRVPAILREPGTSEDDQPTRVNIASVST